MNAPGERRPIVIRRKKVVHNHHGGSWKIALADFMTALMALFLVMWILSTATDEQRQGVSEYFSTPLVGAIRSAGDQRAGSTSVIPGGGPQPQHSEGQMARIDMRQATRMSDVDRRSVLEQQRRSYVALQRRIEAAIQDDPELRELRQQIRFSLTPEGLLIHLIDSQRTPMFELGSDRLEPRMERLLETMAPLLNELPNYLSISGHTDSRPFAAGYTSYSNWELSADRANASRRALVAGGLDGGRLLRVQGMADRVPLPDTDPRDDENRRIALLVLSEDAERQIRTSHDFEESVLREVEDTLLPDVPFLTD